MVIYSDCCGMYLICRPIKFCKSKPILIYQGFLLNGQLTERHKAQKIILQNVPI